MILIIFTVWIFNGELADYVDADFPSTLPYLGVIGEKPINLSFRTRLMSDSLFSFRFNPLLDYAVNRNILVRISPFLNLGQDPAYPLPEWKGGIKGDFEEAGIVFRFRPLTILLGRIRRRWGVTENSLILSGWNYPFDSFGFRLEKRPLLFSYFHGRLERLTGDTTLIPLYGDTIISRYLVGHRLEFRLSSKINLGFTETCLYATPSGIDISYLNPLLLYYEVQWNKPAWEGEKVDDNIVWSFDFRINLKPNFYGEIMLDDYQYEPPPDSEPNEIGFTLGIEYPFPNFTLFAEYTRLNNFCYNTERPYLRYAYLGQPLGYYHGPDVDDLRFGGRYRQQPLIFELTLIRHRKGVGKFSDPWPEGQFPRPDFLTGVVEKDYGIDVSVKALFKRLFFRVSGGIHKIESYHNKADDDRTLPVFGLDLLLFFPDLPLHRDEPDRGDRIRF